MALLAQCVESFGGKNKFKKMVIPNVLIIQNVVLFQQLIASNTLINCNKCSKPQSTAANQTIYALNLAITAKQVWPSQIHVCIFFDFVFVINVWIAQLFMLPLVKRVTGLNPHWVYMLYSYTSE